MNRRLVFLMLLAIVLSTIVTAATTGKGGGDGCSAVRHVARFKNRGQVENKGFIWQVDGPGTSYTFDQEGARRYLSLQVNPFPFQGDLVSSRITEIDTSLPIDDRIKCWQPTENKNVKVKYEFRFREAVPGGDLTENLMLWNAPNITGEVERPLTAVGITRSPFLQGYFAFVAEDVLQQGGNLEGRLTLVPMPPWVDPTNWHTVTLNVSLTDASISVKQNGVSEVVMQANWQDGPPPPLGFEFSLDNELVSGVEPLISPVTIGDRLDIASYKARYLSP